ncbi:hypothetical protein [Psychromonas arctica]|uniref:hypothetical protein n=1 Tax=Psychromonas arctica TaxID=168275 RepID=UPI002FD07540
MRIIKLLLVTSCVTPLLVIDTVQSAINERCTTVEINQVYYHDHSSTEHSETLSQLYDKQVTALNAFAIKEGLDNLSIISETEDSKSKDIPDKLEMNVSMTFERGNYDNIIDKINTELNPDSFSYSSLILKNTLCKT